MYPFVGYAVSAWLQAGVERRHPLAHFRSYAEMLHVLRRHVAQRLQQQGVERPCVGGAFGSGRHFGIDGKLAHGAREGHGMSRWAVLFGSIIIGGTSAGSTKGSCAGSRRYHRRLGRLSEWLVTMS